MRLPILLTAVLLAASLPAVSADSVEAGVASDRFVVGGSVRQSKPVEGDMFGLGGNVDLNASVRGDAVLVGGDVRVREPVAHDLYAAGGNVRVDAAIGHNARLAGGDVEISQMATISGNLSVAGGRVEMRGTVAGNVEVAGGDVLIDGPVAGDVRSSAGNLQLGPNARIAGRLVNRGNGRISRDPAAQVGGGVENRPATHIGSARVQKDDDDDESVFGWLWSLGLIALGGLIAALFPVGSRTLSQGLRNDPGIGLLMGFITLVCVPIAAVILAVTIIGIPLAIAVLLLYFIMLIVGYAAVGVVIGDAALARLRSQDAARAGWRVGAAMGVMLALALLTRVPVLGGLVVFVALMAGLGALVLAIRARTSAPSPAA